jgi:hypothetical protein
VPVNETSEQNTNGYCNVDFVFTLDQTNSSFICGIKVILSIVVTSLSWPLRDPRGSFLKSRGRLCGLAATVLFVPSEPHYGVHAPNNKNGFSAFHVHTTLNDNTG